ncbi:MAG: transglutaminase-like domain-containing protein [Candidatus Omnitrophica bacterium]|nr:transglutaminase-like domain-containing protein [Candidatus Omnitrophota bacterium]MDD5591921.1 transglutaminase-like domain-containing protein [Candidatus Omnitrophota bacterium]
MAGNLRKCFLKISVFISYYLFYFYALNKNYSKIVFGFKDTKRSSGLIDTEDKLLQYLKIEKNIRIEEYYNYSLENNYKYKFDYQLFSEPKLEILRNEYALEKLVEPGRNELAKFEILQDWVRRQWEYGYPGKLSRDYDAIDILRKAKRGGKFWCSEYAVVFIQCALSLGYQARYVALGKGHVIAEIWSNEYKKWVIMDPTFNIHFERQAIPLNCLDLFDSFNGNQIGEICVIEGNYKPEDICIKFGEHELVGISIKNYRHKTMDYYAGGFSVRMRNDWFTNKYPKLHPKGNMVTNSITWIGSKGRAAITNEQKDIYFPLNVTTIGLERTKGGNFGFNIFLNTFTPNFSHYIVSVDEKQKETTESNSIGWVLHKGKNAFKVTSVNKFGVKGVNSFISLFLE